jgi:hypothetical protein
VHIRLIDARLRQVVTGSIPEAQLGSQNKSKDYRTRVLIGGYSIFGRWDGTFETESFNMVVLGKNHAIRG